MTAERRETTLIKLSQHARKRFGSWRVRFGEWRQELREHPSLFWRTPAVRITLWVIAAITLLAGIRWCQSAITRSGMDTSDEDETYWSMLYVACTRPDCRAEFTTRQPMDFHQWPLKCGRCGADSVYRAQLCPTCRKWFATAPGHAPDCPFCAAQRAASQPAHPVPNTSHPTNPDDAEDPWK
jgi:hypothetical protein